MTLKQSGIAFLMSFLISQVTVVAVYILISIVLSMTGMSEASIERALNGTAVSVISSLSMQVIFFLTFMFFHRRYDMHTNVFERQRFDIWQILLCCAMGVFSMFMLSGVVSYFELFLRTIHYPIAEMPFVIDNVWTYLLAILSMAIAPAVCEELLFRGAILSGLRQKGNVFAIFMSAVMFSVFHLSATQFIYPFLFGVLLATIMVKTKNIWYCVIVHFCNNLVSITINFINHSAQTTEFAHSTSNLIYTIVTFALWMLMMWVLLRKRTALKDADQHDSVLDDSASPAKAEIQKDEKLYFWGCFAIMAIVWIIIFISEYL